MSSPQKMLDPNDSLSIRDQCQLLGINRSSYYYKHKEESQENLRIMRLMDTFFVTTQEYPLSIIRSSFFSVKAISVR